MKQFFFAFLDKVGRAKNILIVSKDFNFLSSANLSLDDDDDEHLSVLFAKLEKKTLFVSFSTG